MSKVPEREVLTDGDGRPVLTYVRGTREGRPLADLAEAMPGTDPAQAVLDGLPGWVVAGPVDLGMSLTARGARPLRHSHEMVRDLVADPPPPEWATAPLTGGARVVPCDRSPREIFPAWRAAFGPDHPDHDALDDEHALTGRLVPLLAGDAVGPLLPCSALAVDAGDRVVAGVLVAEHDPVPWIADVFRMPGTAYAGLGADLIRHVVATAAADGLTRLGLAVTEGNPAFRIYDRLGFDVTGSFMSVVVPGVARPGGGGT